MPRRALRPTLCLLLLAAACGSGFDPPTSVGAPAAPSSSPAPDLSTSRPASTPPPSPSAPAPTAAADGTDVAACRDGSCEVFVRGTVTIPLDPRFGFTSFVVTHVPPTNTSVFGEDPVNGNLHGDVGGVGRIEANGIVMTIVNVDANGEILRFTPRPP